MRRKRIFSVSIALITVMFVAGLSGCPTEAKPKPKPNADAAELRDISLDADAFFAANIPQSAFSGEDLETVRDDGYEDFPDDDYLGQILVSNFTGSAQWELIADVSPNASYRYYVTGGSAAQAANFAPDPEEDYWREEGETGFTYAVNHYVFVEVTPKSGKIDKIKYYRFRLGTVSSSATLINTANALTIENLPATVGGGGATWEALTGNAVGAATLPLALGGEDVGIALAQASVPAGATVQLGKSAGGVAMPTEWTDGLEAALSFAQNDALVIKVTSEDGSVIRYYKIDITIGSSVNTLQSLTVAGVTATLGTPSAALASVAAGKVTLPLNGGISTQVAAVLAAGAGAATVEYAAVTGSGEPAFADASTFTFASGDFLYVKITSETEAVNYYKIEVEVGSSDATLNPAYEVVGNADRDGEDREYSGLIVDGIKAAGLGTPNANAALAVAGSVGIPMFFEAYTGPSAVVAAANDSAATVEYGLGTETTVPAAYSASGSVTFTATSYLYVKITAENGTTTLYYKFQILFNRAGLIQWGSPTFTGGTVDDAWKSNQLQVYKINNIITNDSTGWTTNRGRTFGEARVMWDSTGLSVFVVVADTTGPYGGTSDPSSNGHTYDSVEIFINERYENGNVIKNPTTYANKGGQYRVSASGRRSTDPTSIQTSWGAGASGGTYPKYGWNITADDEWALTDPTDNEKKAGYIVTFKCPWRFATTASSEGGPWPPVNDKKIGFDLQINECTAAGTRVGALVWNNTTSSNYQNCSNWGEATLVGRPLAVAGSLAARTSDTEAAINITASEAATAYCLVKTAGDPEPENTDVKGGTSLGAVAAGAAVSKIVTLMPGAKDIYVVVENAAGAVSEPLKIEALAYEAIVLSAPTIYRTSATAAVIGFTSDKAGVSYYYTQVADTAADSTLAEVIAGTSVTSEIIAGANTGKAVTFPTGATARNIFVAVKGATGSVSNVLKIEAAAYSSWTLTAGTQTRTSDTEAAIGFTTTRAGTAYYLDYANTGAAPSNATVRSTGISLGAVAAETVTDKAVTLTAGARRIFVVIQDADGSVSAALSISVPAYVEPEDGV